MIAGIVNQIVNTLLPFALRTVMVYSLGIEYAGINSLFSSILSMLSMADLGFSGAVVFAMYKPVKENDTRKLCQLLGYYQKIYIAVGSIIGIAGIAITPFLKQIVTSTVPGGLNLYVLYYGFLFNTVVSYFFGGYRSSILLAYQRNDLFTYITTAATGIGYGLQIAAMLVFRNYYLYIALMILMNVFITMSGAWMARKKFPEIKPEKGIADTDRKTIFSKVKDLLFQRIGNTV